MLLIIGQNQRTQPFKESALFIKNAGKQVV